MDVLSTVLKTVKLEGAMSYNAEFSTPRSFRSPPSCLGRLGRLIKTLGNLQDLSRRIYRKRKTEVVGGCGVDAGEKSGLKAPVPTENPIQRFSPMQHCYIRFFMLLIPNGLLVLARHNF
jgi:hypothetical protein